jgi:3-deoxy-7-phosphoheptulonate synthase
VLILMKAGATREEIEAVKARVRELGFTPAEIPGSNRPTIGITGNTGPVEPGLFAHLGGVAETVALSRPWKLVSREVKPEDTVIRAGGGAKGAGAGAPSILGGGHFGVIAGPAAVESREQMTVTARAVRAAGAHFLRGGAFMPQTSPYSFRGLKEDGLKILAEARELTGLPVVTEVLDARYVDLVVRYADVLQVGARSMQNFPLLEAVGQQPKPVMLKRHRGAGIEEWLMAAEYIVKQGNYQVILCERGIKTFETMSPNLLDLSSVPLVKRLTHLPVIVDPSHGTGDFRFVPAMARAAVAAGADGIMVEVHPTPASALYGGPQALTPGLFDEMMPGVRAVAAAVGAKA